MHDFGNSGVIWGVWGRSGVILECRIIVCNYSVEPSIQIHNRVLGSLVSTWLLPDSTQNRFTFFTSSVQITTTAKIAKACVFAPSSGFWDLLGTELPPKSLNCSFYRSQVRSSSILTHYCCYPWPMRSYLSDIGKLQWRLKCGRDFQSGVCSRFWGWSLVEVLKLRFGQDFEAGFWSACDIT